jgi:hypothetical protein
VTTLNLPRARGKPPRLRGAAPVRGDHAGAANVGLTPFYLRLGSAQLRRSIAFWRFIQRSFDLVFWSIEQHIGILQDKLQRRFS